MRLHQPIDLLLVDGPPGTLQKQSRYPALPLLRSYLHPKSWILMDDANRQDEQEISKRWEEEFGLTSQTLPAEKGALLLTFKPSIQPQPQTKHEERPSRSATNI